jgi:uncharacterized SAM-binding protein YcdF (DUF218 family)
MIMPIPVFFLLLLAAFFFSLINRKRTSRIFLFLSFFWFLIISTKPFPEWVVKTLEKNYPQLSEKGLNQIPDSVNIIVLGGGNSDDMSLSPNNQLSVQALGRLVEGIRIQKKIPGSMLVVSGNSGRSKLAQAEVLFRTAIMLGLDSASVRISPLPGNTNSEAEEYVKLFGRSDPVVVVTSAIHMRRSEILFRKKGVKVIPAPVNHILKQGSVRNPWRWVPQSGYISLLEQAMHEYVGILWAWMGGR